MKQVLLLLAVLTVPAFAQTAPAKKFNVLFIAADDLNNRLPMYGYPEVKAPNLERLAKVSMRFDAAYCQYPLCNPSRTSMLTGLRPDTTKIYQNEVAPRTFIKDAVWMPEYFHANGYFTARVGKIAHGTFEHVASKWDQQGRPEAPDDDMKGKGSDSWIDEQGKPQKPQFWAFHKSELPDDGFLDGASARIGAKFLEEHKDKPFFIGVGFHRPHLPWVAPKKYFDLYAVDQLKFPPEPANDRADIPAGAIGYEDKAAPMSDAERRQHLAAYYACISYMDAQVGVVLDAMDRLKLWDNTIVVFWGDHGYMLGEHGLQRKRSLFEQAARVPLLIHVPGKPGGTATKAIVEVVDFYQTLTDLSGLAAPKDLEGTSFARLFDDPQRAWKKAAFTLVQREELKNLMGRSVVTDRYRYSEWGGEDQCELYDHQSDPGEYTNLAKSPAHAKTLAEMRQMLKDGWRKALPEGVK